VKPKPPTPAQLSDLGRWLRSQRKTPPEQNLQPCKHGCGLVLGTVASRKHWPKCPKNPKNLRRARLAKVRRAETLTPASLGRRRRGSGAKSPADSAPPVLANLSGGNGWRHTAFTRWAEAGIPIATMMARGGHCSPKMTAHYTHISMQAERLAMESMDRGHKKGPISIEAIRTRKALRGY